MGSSSSSRVVDIDRGYQHLLKSFSDMKDVGVYVGIREDKGAVKPEGSDATVAEYATYNEFGTRTIPERSFLRSWEQANRAEAVKRMGEAAGKVIDGAQTVYRAFGLVGAWAVRGVQRNIWAIDTPPNAPSTRERKKSSNPLIDKDRMRGSIEYEVKEDDR